MNQEFYINEIKILIRDVSPNEIIDNFNNFNNYIKSIRVTYNTQYTDPALLENEGLVNLTCHEIINIETFKLNNYVDINELKKEYFYDLIIKQASSSENLNKLIAIARNRKGLDESAKAHNLKNKFKFK